MLGDASHNFIQHLHSLIVLSFSSQLVSQERCVHTVSNELVAVWLVEVNVVTLAPAVSELHEQVITFGSVDSAQYLLIHFYRIIVLERHQAINKTFHVEVVTCATVVALAKTCVKVQRTLPSFAGYTGDDIQDSKVTLVSRAFRECPLHFAADARSIFGLYKTHLNQLMLARSRRKEVLGRHVIHHFTTAVAYLLACVRAVHKRADVCNVEVTIAWYFKSWVVVVGDDVVFVAHVIPF